MQTREFLPIQPRSPGLPGDLAWPAFGTGSFIDSSDASGRETYDRGGVTSADLVAADDATIPALATIRSVILRARLGVDGLTAQEVLGVTPYICYDGFPPVFQGVVHPPNLATFGEFDVEFPRDPAGLPWRRATLFARRERLLRFGLRTAPTDAPTARLQWTELRFRVTYDLPIPIVVTDPASLIADSHATLNGRFNPRSANGTYPVTWWFEYGPTVAYGTSTLPVAGVTGDLDLVVSKEVTGLVVGGGYHYRLAVSNADGTYYGEDQFFRTDPLASGRWRLDEFKRLATGGFTAGDRTRETSVGFDRPATTTDFFECPFLVFP